MKGIKPSTLHPLITKFDAGYRFYRDTRYGNFHLICYIYKYLSVIFLWIWIKSGSKYETD